MEKRISVFEWILAFNEGKYDKEDVKTQIEAGWYDWFCKDSSLVGKTKRLGNIVKGLKKGGRADIETCYVWFKNNCPLNGPLYDDIRIADLETGEVQLTIQVNCCWNNHRYTVWGRRGKGKDFEHDKPLFETDSLRELTAWLNTSWEE